MMSFGINPFAWSKEEGISGTVASLTITSDNGSAIPVENLDEEIEVQILMASYQSFKDIS